MRTTTEVFQDHLKRRLEGDLEGDIKANFAADTAQGTVCDGPESFVIKGGEIVFQSIHYTVRDSSKGEDEQ